MFVLQIILGIIWLIGVIFISYFVVRSITDEKYVDQNYKKIQKLFKFFKIELK